MQLTVYMLNLVAAETIHLFIPTPFSSLCASELSLMVRMKLTFLETVRDGRTGDSAKILM